MLDIAGIKIQSPLNVERLLSMIIWGKSGCGKTVAAVTLPGKKLWFQFDKDGCASLGVRDDYEILDLSGVTHNKIIDFEEGGMVERDLTRHLKERTEIQSIVVDSATAISALALTHAVLSGKANGAKFKATIEQPGLAGYGIRNRIVLGVVRMFLRVAAEAGKHICIVCHEDSPDKDSDGNIINISVLLGGTLPQEVPMQISEVWYMEDDGKNRFIHLRPYMKRNPMRTRMFRTTKQTHFQFLYDLETRTGNGIAQWFEQWKQASFDKIDPPMEKRT